jgi:hypothetical protein
MTMTYIDRTQVVNDLMIDLRTMTGDATYHLKCWGATEDELEVQLWAGKGTHSDFISPRLGLDAMEDYLTAYLLGAEAGYQAAKRGR